jgi:hypothetical protein
MVLQPLDRSVQTDAPASRHVVMAGVASERLR